MLLPALLTLQFPGQQPWPVARQDRYGSGHSYATVSEDDLPWIDQRTFYAGIDTPLTSTLDRSTVIGSDGSIRLLTSSGPFGSRYTYGAFSQLIPPGNASTEWAYSPAIDASNNRLFAVNRGTAAGIAMFRSPGGNPPTGIFDAEWYKAYGDPAGSPNLTRAGDVVFCARDGRVLLLDPESGDIKWTADQLGRVNSGAVISRSERLVIAPSRNTVVALRVGNGVRAWRRSIGGQAGAVACAPNGTVMFGDDLGNLYGLDPETGDIRWQSVAGGAVVSPAAFDGDRAYFCVQGVGRLIGVDVNTGQVQMSRDFESPTNYAPIVDGNGFVYLTAGPHMICSTPDGRTVWDETVPFSPGQHYEFGEISMAPDGTLIAPTNRGVGFFVRQGIAYAPTNPNAFQGRRIPTDLAEWRAKAEFPDNEYATVRAQRSGSASPEDFARLFFQPFYFKGSRADSPYYFNLKSRVDSPTPVTREIRYQRSNGSYAIYESRTIPANVWLNEGFNLTDRMSARENSVLIFYKTAAGADISQTKVKIDWASVGWKPAFR